MVGGRQSIILHRIDPNDMFHLIADRANKSWLAALLRAASERANTEIAHKTELAENVPVKRIASANAVRKSCEENREKRPQNPGSRRRMDPRNEV
jgi:hypothetical protein